MRAHVARWLLQVPLGKELPGRWEGGGVGGRMGEHSVSVKCGTQCRC